MADVKVEKPLEPKKVVKKQKNVQEVLKKIEDLKAERTGKVFKSTEEALAAKLPQHFVLDRVIDGYSREMQALTYFTTETFTKKTVYISKSIPILDRPSPYAVEKQQKFKEHRIKNIGIHLNNMGMTIGFDPEIFVEDKRGEIIPAWEYLKFGELFKTKEAGQFGAQNVYADGFAAEFNTAAGVTCLGWAADMIRYGLHGVLHYARLHNSQCKLSGKTLIEVPYEVLHELPDKYVEFGCKPSYNAYGLQPKEELVGRNTPFRSSGGHIHFGIGQKPKEQMEEIVKTLDAALAVPCVSLFEGLDDPIRRQFYGMAGEYRTPPHGLEYRVLSGALIFVPAIFNMLVDYARQVVSFGHNGFRDCWKSTEEETIECIMSCDTKLARQIIERNKNLIISILKSRYDLDKSETAYRVLLEGTKAVVKNPEDVVGNWSLEGGWTPHCDGTKKNWTGSFKFIKDGGKL